MSKFTKAQAIDEITWRAIPKPRPARDFEGGLAEKASGAELRAKAGQPKAARKAPAVKAPKAPKVLTLEEQVSRLVGRAAKAHAKAITPEGETGFVKNQINARTALLSAGDLYAQTQAATQLLAAYGDAEAIAALAEIG